MWRFLGGLFSFFCVILWLTRPTEALRLKISWGEKVDLSENIFRGRVVLVKSYWNPEKTLVYTDVKVLVDEYLKGDGPKEITVNLPGGTVGEITQWVSDTPQFDVGSYYVILLESSGQVTGGPDGVYLLKGEDGDRFLIWLRAYIGGDPKVSKEGPPATPRLQRK
jgi:hypothetical protein